MGISSEGLANGSRGFGRDGLSTLREVPIQQEVDQHKQLCLRRLGVRGRRAVTEGSIRRFRCKPCEPTVTEAVPWARYDSDFTSPFEDPVGLMAQCRDQTAVSQIFRAA